MDEAFWDEAFLEKTKSYLQYKAAPVALSNTGNINEKYKLETLREREGGGCYSNGSQQAALGPIGPS